MNKHKQTNVYRHKNITPYKGNQYKTCNINRERLYGYARKRTAIDEDMVEGLAHLR
jgi:hypothetical protein